MGLQVASSSSNGGHVKSDLEKAVDAAKLIRAKDADGLEELERSYTREELERLLVAHPLLHTAARVGNLRCIQTIASWHSPKRLTETLASTITGQTLLYRVAAGDGTEILEFVVNLLLTQTPAVQERNMGHEYLGNSPLFEFAHGKRWPVLSKVVKVLQPLLTDAILDKAIARPVFEKSMLGRVLSYGNTDNIQVAQELLGPERIETAFNSLRESALLFYDAVEGGNTEAIEWALQHLRMAHPTAEPAVPNLYPERSSLLVQAAKSGSLETFMYIVNLTSDEDVETMLKEPNQAQWLLFCAARSNDPRLFLEAGRLVPTEHLADALRSHDSTFTVLPRALKTGFAEKGPILQQLITRLSPEEQVLVLKSYFSHWDWEPEARKPGDAEELCKFFGSFPLEIRRQVPLNVEAWISLNPARRTLIKVSMAMLQGQPSAVQVEAIGKHIHDLVFYEDAEAVEILLKGLDHTALLEVMTLKKPRNRPYYQEVEQCNLPLFKALKMAWARLDPEDRIQLLDCGKYGGIITAIAKNKGVKMLRVASQGLRQEELLAALQPNRKGRTPLHLALKLSKRGMVAAIMDLVDRSVPESRALILQEDHQGRTPLHHLSNASIDSVVAELISRLSDEELDEMLAPDHHGRSCLFSLVSYPLPSALRLLLGRTSDAQKKELLKPDIYGGTILHHAARKSVYNQLMLLLDWIGPGDLPQLGQGDLSQLGQGDNMGDTPLHLAAMGNPEVLRACIHLRSRCDAKTQALWIRPNKRGEGLLLSAACSSNPQNIRMVGSILRAKGLLADAFRANCDGTTPLHITGRGGGDKPDECMAELVALATEDQLRQCLKPNRLGETPVSRHVFLPALPLLDLLSDSYSVAVALGKCPSHETCKGPMKPFLDRRYPTKMDVLKLLLTQMVILNKLEGLHTEYFEDAAKHPIFPLLGTTQNIHMGCDYDRVTEGLAPYMTKLQAQIDKLKGTDRAVELGKRKESLITWQKMLLATLVARDIPAARAVELMSFWRRMIRMADAPLRHEITKLVLRYPPSGFSDALRTEAEKGKQALLFLIPLEALFQRGTCPNQLSTIAEMVLKEGKALSTDSRQGKILLSALTKLAHCSDLKTDDIQHLLRLVSTGDLRRDCHAIDQIIQMNRIDELSREQLEKTGNQLHETSQRCFQGVLGIKHFDKFTELYERYIASQRNPDSVITYASLHHRDLDVREDFAKFLTWVLRGEFHDRRYALDNSAHLAKLYELQPELQERLRKLTSNIGRSPVGEEKSQTNPFPIGKTELYDKIIDDEDLDHEEYPYIVKYLTAKSLKEARKIEIQLGKEASKTKAKALKLQTLLIKLCKGTDDPKSLEIQLRSANNIAKELGVFKTHLSDAITTLESSRARRSTTFEALVTDHYWDLFQIGTDVVGSCQKIHGTTINKCLMGYVLDGRTFAVVIKKAGEEAVIARCILRIEIHKKSQTPALFLERLYGNYKGNDIKDAIIKKAKDVANYLQLPLYHGTDGTSNTTLESIGCAAHWTYSDAGPGSSRGKHLIYNCQLLYKPAARTIAASSSSC